MIDERNRSGQQEATLEDATAGPRKARWRPVIVGWLVGLALVAAIAAISFFNRPSDEVAKVSTADTKATAGKTDNVAEDVLVAHDSEGELNEPNTTGIDIDASETAVDEFTLRDLQSKLDKADKERIVIADGLDLGPPAASSISSDEGVAPHGFANEASGDQLDEGADSASADAILETEEYAPLLKDGFGGGESQLEGFGAGLGGRGKRRSGAIGRGATRYSETRADAWEKRVIEGKGRRDTAVHERATPAVESESLPAEPQGRDQFAKFHDNRFLTVGQQPLSTFSIDVDTGAYSFLRNCLLSETKLPPPAAVRIEELVNYFAYNYAQPADGTPFAVHVDIAACPWQTKHRLARIALKGREISKDKRPPSNLVFLIDVSGSMDQPNKLPLVRVGLVRLVDQLDERDRVAIVVYAGESGCVLPSTVCSDENKTEIKDAIRTLTPGGSTNGESGIQLAYQIAKDHFVPKGANRVILCTDGDWNVGTTDTDSLKKLVADRAKEGVFLSALGFGMGNLNDHMLEQIADNGNGVYGYIDDESEIEKLFVKQLSGTLVTIAKDVKIQVEFNPAHVAGYRLIGYENRVLAKEDFNDDKKDAGDIGAGHTVTALYEIVPAGMKIETPEGAVTTPSVDDLEFQAPKKKEELEPTEKAKTSGDILLVKLRYKEPDGDKSTLIKHPVKDGGGTFAAAGEDFRFAAAVAAFGMCLRGSPFKGDITLATVEEIATASVGEDKDRHRRELVDLVKRARATTEKVPAGGPER